MQTPSTARHFLKAMASSSNLHGSPFENNLEDAGSKGHLSARSQVRGCLRVKGPLVGPEPGERHDIFPCVKSPIVYVPSPIVPAPFPHVASVQRSQAAPDTVEDYIVDRRRQYWIWASGRDSMALHTSRHLLRRSDTTFEAWSQLEGWHTGEPNSVMPNPGRIWTGVTLSSSGKEDGEAGPQTWHFLMSTFNPVRLVSDCRAAREVSKWILVPIRAPSSKYQEHHGTVEKTRVAMGWKAQ